jgi:hypothetical protein
VNTPSEANCQKNFLTQTIGLCIGRRLPAFPAADTRGATGAACFHQQRQKLSGGSILCLKPSRSFEAGIGEMYGRQIVRSMQRLDMTPFGPPVEHIDEFVRLQERQPDQTLSVKDHRLIQKLVDDRPPRIVKLNGVSVHDATPSRPELGLANCTAAGSGEAASPVG